MLQSSKLLHINVPKSFTKHYAKVDEKQISKGCPKKKPAFLITLTFEAFLSDDNHTNSFSPNRYVQYGPNKKNLSLIACL